MLSKKAEVGESRKAELCSGEPGDPGKTSATGFPFEASESPSFSALNVMSKDR
jgi:hypothetical protein